MCFGLAAAAFLWWSFLIGFQPVYVRSRAELKKKVSGKEFLHVQCQVAHFRRSNLRALVQLVDNNPSQATVLRILRYHCFTRDTERAQHGRGVRHSLRQHKRRGAVSTVCDCAFFRRQDFLFLSLSLLGVRRCSSQSASVRVGDCLAAERCRWRCVLLD